MKDAYTTSETTSLPQSLQGPDVDTKLAVGVVLVHTLNLVSNNFAKVATLKHERIQLCH